MTVEYKYSDIAPDDLLDQLFILERLLPDTFPFWTCLMNYDESCSSIMNFVPAGTWTVTGDVMLEPGETATYYHNLGPGAIYTGDLPGTAFENEDGNGATVTMPANAGTGAQYEVSFSGVCNSSATMGVQALTADCSWGVPLGEGAFPGPGAYVNEGGDRVSLIGAKIISSNYGISTKSVGEWFLYSTGGVIYHAVMIAPHYKDLYAYTLVCDLVECGGIC